ncbi:MAG: hypothetical protein B6I24_01330 [Bacteroidetes bacterium 4572_128]|nr:MAG: hypothetical protein B6I24_01330 [Bacteroidetes bacterium 4572_128]
MKINNIRLVAFLGTFSIIGIIVVQIYWLQNFWTTTEQQFDKNIQDALKNVAENLIIYNGHNLPNKNPVKKLSSNYYVVNIGDLIDAYILEYYLKIQFNKFNIYTDFEYAIYECTKDTMIYGNYVSLSNNKNIEKIQIFDFQKCDKFLYYFGIFFPKKKNYLAENMFIWSVFSGILLLALTFFSYSLFIIFKQKRLSQLQKEFINNMTHEFKTPISTINISADVISDEKILKNPQRLFNYVNIIKQENKRLNNQVEKVLQITKIEKQNIELNIEEIDLHNIIKNIVEKRSNNCNHKNLKFFIDLEEKKFKFFADKLHFINIIYNLLDNSIKYNFNNNLEISISTKKTSKNLILEIKDNGIGISNEFQKKIFDKFFRVPTGNIHNVKGFGLGLYYVKTICNAHKWKIILESEINKYCSFKIFLIVQ